MKKTVLSVAFILFVSLLYAASFSEGRAVDYFDSIPMLDSYYKEEPVDDSQYNDYFEKTKVEIITVSKDYPLYSWFGHCGILIAYPDREPLMFDYGNFSFDSSFYKNFAMGRLWYKCGCSYADWFIQYQKDSKRTVSAIELDITPVQKRALCYFLAENIKEENQTYLYHHYKDNCATRVRDIVDRITGGDFAQWAKSIEGVSFRKQTSRILYASRPIMWILDFLQSGHIDVECTRWDEMFLPSNLERSLLEYGKIVKNHTYYSDFRDIDTRHKDSDTPVGNIFFSLSVGIALAAIIFISRRYCVVLYKVSVFLTDIILGLLGLLLLFMSVFTSHDVTWMNENIIFINPLLIVAGILILSGKSEKKSQTIMRIITLCLSVLVILKILFPGIFIQDNISQIVLVFPYYTVCSFSNNSKLP